MPEVTASILNQSDLSNYRGYGAELTSVGRSVAGRTAYALDLLYNKEVFGSPSSKNPDISPDAYEDIRSFIRLNHEVLNNGIAGKNGHRFARILGIQPGIVASILKCELCIVLTEVDQMVDETVMGINLYRVANLDIPASDALLGARVLKAILDHMFPPDKNPYAIFEQMAIDRICDAILKEFFTESASVADIGTVDCIEGGIHVAGDIYYHPTPSNAKLKKKYKEAGDADFSHYFKYRLLNSPLKPVPIILNASLKSLYGMITDIIRVTPAGIRPVIDGKFDPSSKLFEQIYNASSSLSLIGLGEKVGTYAGRVREIQKAVDALQRDGNPQSKTKAILGLLNGKDGIMRHKLIGKRVDWSGRCVIVADPTCKISEAHLPFTVARRIYGFHLRCRGVNMEDDVEVMRVLEEDLAPRIPIVINRAPTLHALSVLSFYPKIWKKKAIGLNPWVCSGYNADFDGDTVAVHVPLGQKAIEEARTLLFAPNNLYVPASGKITIKPKQEIIYGLYCITMEEHETGVNVGPLTPIEAFTACCNQTYSIYDTSGDTTVGRLALSYCLPKGVNINMVPPVTKSTIENLITIIIKGSHGYEQMEDYLFDLNTLGFSVATHYARPVDILDTDDDIIREPIEEFMKEIEPVHDLYLQGFLTSEEYGLHFSELYGPLKDKVAARVVDTVTYDNCYVTLAETGARGNRSNLFQIFGAKGSIQRTSAAAFNSLVDTSFIDQLSPSEHFMSAYGTRKSLIDKVLKTGQTGDLWRRCSHVASPFIITEEDCGTSDGIYLSTEYIASFLPPTSDGTPDLAKAKKYLLELVKGRYDAKTGERIPDDFNGDEILMRSPLTCENPCCSKCYGDDLCINNEAIPGLPIGFIAGQSIGEPGTQLTMRTFHGGGIAGSSDVSSIVEQLESVFNMKDRTISPSYDPVAWADGEVRTVEARNGTRVYIGDDPYSILVPRGANIKKHVERGDSMGGMRGDVDLKELIHYAGLPAAELHAALTMWRIYKGEAEVNFKHFEVLTLGMRRYTYVGLSMGGYRVGERITANQYAKLPSSVKSCYTPIMVGSTRAPSFNPSFIESFVYRYLDEEIFRSAYHGSVDDLTQHFSRIAVGLPPLLGTEYNPNFAYRRTELCSN